MPFMEIPSSSEITATFIRDVADSPYGSQFDIMLNQAYSDGMIQSPMTMDKATTLVVIRLRSVRYTFHMFFILVDLLITHIFIIVIINLANRIVRILIGCIINCNSGLDIVQ